VKAVGIRSFATLKGTPTASPIRPALREMFRVTAAETWRQSWLKRSEGYKMPATMGVKVKFRNGAWWVYRNHGGRRRAKKIGDGRPPTESPDAFVNGSDSAI
jgi:hypothetical protein